MDWKSKPFDRQVALVTGGGSNVRAFNLCPGFVHVSDMGRTLLCALSPDRNVVLEDINIYAR